MVSRSRDEFTVSVLINNYNYGRYLKECIDSVVNQGYQKLEVIVVDDGSTDASREVIGGYGNRIKAVLKENGGQASSFNAGFEVSTGKILFLLDSDDKFLPRKIQQSVEIYGKFDVSWLFDRASHATDANPRAIELDRDIEICDYRSGMRHHSLPAIPVPTSGLSFRRELLEKILPMPVSKGITLSDNYLKFASSALGIGAICHVPLTFQRIHDNNRYTGKDNSIVDGRIMFETGYQLARKYPYLKGVAFQLVSGGLATKGSFDRSEQWRQLQRCAALESFGIFDIAMIVVMAAGKRLRAAFSA